MRPTRWEDCERDDLRCIPKMESNGFTTKFSSQDRTYKRVSIEHIPNDAVSFSRGATNIWKTYQKKDDGIYSAWTLAELVDGHYTGHKVFDEIEDVLKFLAGGENTPQTHIKY